MSYFSLFTTLHFLFTGAYGKFALPNKPNPETAPKSQTQFVTLSSLDKKTIHSLLYRVYTGHIALKDLEISAKKVRGMKLLQRFVVEAIQTYSENRSLVYEDVQKEYPMLTTPAFINEWIMTIVQLKHKLKDTCPEALKNAIFAALLPSKRFMPCLSTRTI